MPVYTDEVEFRGHPLVRSLHRNTIEVTREPHLTLKGDCIIGVNADKGPSDLNAQVREALMMGESKVRIGILVEDMEFVVRADGSRGLTLKSHEEMVIRKSEFTSDRTLAVHADAGAKDIPRALVERLRSPAAVATLRLEVHVR